jgi:hypothetical protein
MYVLCGLTRVESVRLFVATVDCAVKKSAQGAVEIVIHTAHKFTLRSLYLCWFQWQVIKFRLPEDGSSNLCRNVGKNYQSMLLRVPEGL